MTVLSKPSEHIVVVACGSNKGSSHGSVTTVMVSEDKVKNTQQQVA